MDVVQPMSEAVAQVPNVGDEVVQPTHASSTMSDHVLEEFYSTHEPSTIPIESNSCKNSQFVEKEISSVAIPHRSSRSRNPPKRVVDFLLIENSKIIILEF